MLRLLVNLSSPTITLYKVIQHKYFHKKLVMIISYKNQRPNTFVIRPLKNNSSRKFCCKLGEIPYTISNFSIRFLFTYVYSGPVIQVNSTSQLYFLTLMA